MHARDLAPRRLTSVMVTALQGDPPGPLGLTVALSGMLVSDLAFNLRHQVDLLGAVVVAVATQIVVGVVCVAVLGWLAGLRIDAVLRPAVVLGVFTFCGVLRVTLLVVSNRNPSWALWLGHVLPTTIGTIAWFAVSAVLLEWMNRAATQRMRLDQAYRELSATRASTTAALAATQTQLAEVTTNTRASISELGELLRDGVTPSELDQCIERIGVLVDREVRPSSHQLAQMPVEVRSEPSASLWPTAGVRVAAMVRRWPTARPFQPGTVAVLTIPVVFAEVVMAPAEVRLALAERSLLGLGVQFAALTIAAVALTPVLRRLPLRAAIPLAFASYVGMYLIGVVLLMRDADAGVPTPLGAHLFPSVYAFLAGGVSAASAQYRAESARAERIVSLTGANLSRTRQQLWARRRRLALALHGRVQANLTAAGLLLQRVRDRFAEDGAMDVELIDQVREAMRFAWRVDSRSAGSTRDRLERVTTVWSGIMAVDLTLSEHAANLLDRDEDSADACVEVVREILLNAVRHGGATKADVSVRTGGSALIRIQVRESAGGGPAPRRTGTGLGESMIDSVASRWWVRQDGPERVTSVLLPTGPEPAGGAES